MKKKSIPIVPILVAAGCLLGAYFLIKQSSRSERPFHERYEDALKEIKFEDLNLGNASKVEAGDEVEIHYVGFLENGKQFDSTYERKVSHKFTLGKSQVVAGLDLGVVGMQVGGKRKITVPAVLGYGDQPVGDLIPAGSNLLFEVELVSAKKPSVSVSEANEKPKKKSKKDKK